MKKQDTKQLIQLTIAFVQAHILQLASENEGNEQEAIKYEVHKSFIADAIAKITKMGIVEVNEVLFAPFREEETDND